MDLTDVQTAKITFCCVYVLAGVQPATDCVVVVVVFPLPALCIITILVYFFPKKVRRSELPSPNSLSHSPGAGQRGRVFRAAKYVSEGRHQMVGRGEIWTLG